MTTTIPLSSGNTLLRVRGSRGRLTLRHPSRIRQPTRSGGELVRIRVVLLGPSGAVPQHGGGSRRRAGPLGSLSLGAGSELVLRLSATRAPPLSAPRRSGAELRLVASAAAWVASPF